MRLPIASSAAAGQPRLVVAVATALALALALSSCSTAPGRSDAAAAGAPLPTDPLGPRPAALGTPVFRPEAATAFAGPGGSRVLLLERHALPLVTVSVVVPYGSAADPAGMPGLAHVSSLMIDQGAGGRDAAAFALALEDLGAQLSSGVDRDSSTVTLDCLAPRLSSALPLLLSALAEPRHRAEDFDRVAAIWMEELRQRQDQPGEVARVVAGAAVYGASSPHGHATEGVLASAKAVTLELADAWHRAIWRPDAATIVVAGDVTREQLVALLAAAAWTAPDVPRPPLAAPPAIPPQRARTIVVDRPEAPQVMALLVRPGVAASDPARPALDLVNIALGGSFTSRLNQDLREDHGWCYGAGSRFGVRRATGMFVARAAIRADAITDALREMRAVIADVAGHGITAAELAKAQAQSETEAVDSYGTISRIATRLAGNAALGLGPAADADELAAQRTATIDGLTAAARAHLAIDAAIIVLVGPKAPILKAIADDGLPAPEFCDAEGVGLADAAQATP